MEGDVATGPIRKLSSKDPMSSRSRAWRFFRMSLRLIEDSFLHEYLYSYYENKKTPTCQEKYGRVTKKVPKGLNCYSTHHVEIGDVVSEVVLLPCHHHASSSNRATALAMLEVVTPTCRAISAIDNPNSSRPRLAIIARRVLTFLRRLPPLSSLGLIG